MSDNSKAAGRKRGKHLLTHDRIEALACQVLALRLAVVRPALYTLIGVKTGTTIIVMDTQTAATASTHHQPREVRWATPCRPHGIGTGTVGLEPCLIALILLGGNVGWAAIGQQN